MHSEVFKIDNVTYIKQFKGGSMAQTFLINKEDQKCIRKEVRGDKSLGIDKLKKQLDWILALDKDLSLQFPQVVEYNFDNNYGYYDMTFYDMSTFHHYIIENGSLDTDIKNILSKIMLFGSELSQKEVVSNKDGVEYVRNDHLLKMVKRCMEVVQKSPEFKQIYNSPYLFINGQKYLNLNKLIDRILRDQNLLNFLAPQKWCISHGDFTLQNVLTDGKDFKIIDPRGEGEDTVYYDISKLYQSTHGKYDLLFEDNYKCTFDLNNGIIDYEILKHTELFDQIYNIILELIPNTFVNLEDNWHLKALFYEASHFVSMVPFRYKENIEITMLCYALGIKFLNEVLGAWTEIKNTKP
jgi:hypothetical protein